MQNITTRELKHLCNFLTHAMNYKVELVSEEDFAYDEEDGENVYDWISATDELCTQTAQVLDNYFTLKDKTLATAFETAIDYLTKTIKVVTPTTSRDVAVKNNLQFEAITPNSGSGNQRMR